MAETRTNGAGPPDGAEYRTFAGASFGTLIVHPSAGPERTPQVASARRYLRGALPAVYQGGDFGMRFVGGIEATLDPIVAILDSLPAYFDPEHAPSDVLELLAGWMGIALDETQPLAHRRDVVRQAAELSRWRGTARGVRLALTLSFPDVPLRVEDRGGVRWTPDQESAPVPAPSFVVYCDEPVPEDVQAAIARCIEAFKPVGVAYRLRVRSPKTGAPA